MDGWMDRQIDRQLDGTNVEDEQKNENRQTGK